MKKIKTILLSGILILVPVAVTAQSSGFQQALNKGNALRSAYHFDAALEIFNRLLQHNTDSLARSRLLQEITLCENGKNMLKFAASPEVIAKKTVPLDRFYGRYDLHLPGYWALTPKNLLSSLDISPIPPFVYIASTAPETLYFDSHGPDGKTGWDIYETQRMPNGEWSAPQRLSEVINTAFDERFPYVSPDGETLYFSSSGHYGMGGYNLYKSTKNPETGAWGTPENLGFPFSSTADDLLYVPDPDGLFACFASTRNTAKDSITIYKIALEGTPVKQSLTDPAEILRAAELLPPPAEAPEAAVTGKPATEPNRQYNKLLQQAQQIRQRSSVAQEDLDKLRDAYTAANAQEKKALATKIELREQTLSQYRSELQATAKNIQEQEYNMLAQGIVPVVETATPPRPQEKEARPTASFDLQTEKIIVLPEPVVQAPINTVPEVRSFTFKANTQTVIYENESLDGIIYRYQVGVFSKKPEAAVFKGYTPVFINDVNGKWVCGLGAFTSYGEAQKYTAALKRDFKNPILTAYKNGKTIEIKQARLEEGRKPAAPASKPADKNTAYQVVLGEYGTLPPTLLKTVQQATSKDMARSTVNGKTVYVVGPYTSKDEADKVVEILQQSGFAEVRIETVVKK